MDNQKGYFYQTSTEVIVDGTKVRVAKSDAWIFKNDKKVVKNKKDKK